MPTPARTAGLEPLGTRRQELGEAEGPQETTKRERESQSHGPDHLRSSGWMIKEEAILRSPKSECCCARAATRQAG